MAEIQPTETDNILADVMAAQQELEGVPEAGAPEAEVPPQETAEQSAQRARDEAGRFAKEDKPRETLKLKEKPAAEAPVEAPPQTQEAKPAAEPIPPPVEWKGGGKVQWNKLPKDVQAELRQTYDSVAAAKEQYAPLEAAIAPHRDVLVRDAGSVERGIGELMNFYKLYLDNPVGLIQHIARQRGVDLGQAVGQPSQSTQPVPPDINSIIAQAVQQATAPLHERFQQTENQQIESTLSAFASDPKHPYFQDVREDMGLLLSNGKAKTLEEAYSKAVRMNDGIWSQLEEEKAKEAKGSRTADVAKANVARAVNLRGSPIPGASGAVSSSSSVHDDVRAAAAEIAGA